MSRIYLILLTAFAIFINETVFAEGKKNAIFIAPDLVASPQNKVLIKVNLKTKRPFISTPISGERVEFIVDGESIGISLSGGDGVAVRGFTPKNEGVYNVRIRLDEKSRYSANDAEIIVACWRKDTSIILINLDTLAEEDSPDPAPDAKDVVERLSKRYRIILYTYDQNEKLSKRKEWLIKHSFPRLPLLSWRSADIEEEVKDLIGQGWRIKFGIGDRGRDITAFSRGNIIPIILINDKDDEDLPEDTEKVKGWIEIERIILGS